MPGCYARIYCRIANGFKGWGLSAGALQEPKDRAGRQKFLRGPLQPHGGEAAAEPGAGVEAEPVRPDFRRVQRRVAVHDHFLERRLMAEKLVLDPQQVFLDLRVQRNAGPDAAMYEEIISD